MSKLKISCTIAAYNVQQWLPQCLDSILAQSFSDFEVVIVDDCSTDSTANIAETYANRDSRIRVIKHNVNKGLVHSRLTGYQHCSGRYIWHLDGDDHMAPEAMQLLYNIAETDGCDVVRAGMLNDFGNRMERTYTNAWRNIPNTNLSRCEYLAMAPQSLFLNLIRKDFLDECIKTGHEFYATKSGLNLGEDMVFNSALFAKAESISISNKEIYYYRRHGNSYTMMKDQSKRRFLEEARSHARVFETWESFPIAQMIFAITLLPFRMQTIEKLCKYKSRSEAVPVLEEYRKVYTKWNPYIIYKVLNWGNRTNVWKMDHNLRIMRFFETIHTCDADDLFSWIKLNQLSNTEK